MVYNNVLQVSESDKCCIDIMIYADKNSLFSYVGYLLSLVQVLGGAVATCPASDGSSYFVLTGLDSDEDDRNTSTAVNSQSAAVQQSARR